MAAACGAAAKKYPLPRRGKAARWQKAACWRICLMAMKKLTRREIIEEIVKRAGIPSRAADAVLDTVIRKIFSSLAEGAGVEIRGLGSFVHVACKPRVGRNPLEPEKDIPIPPRYKLRFNPGRDLKAKLIKLSRQIPAEEPAAAKAPGSASAAKAAKAPKAAAAAKTPKAGAAARGSAAARMTAAKPAKTAAKTAAPPRAAAKKKA